MDFSNSFGSAQPKPSFLQNISAAIGGMSDGHGFMAAETKKRGMSDVDDTNLRQLQDNTSSMINL
jgi:hypothetical protein